MTKRKPIWENKEFMDSINKSIDETGNMFGCPRQCTCDKSLPICPICNSHLIDDYELKQLHIEGHKKLREFLRQ